MTISIDSSSYGLGACLLQDGHPVSYASRSLNSAEKNYAQIEKELLAIVFGCQKYHQYIYGRVVSIETDHKSLEYIFRKPLTETPPRLQRMMLTLQKYELMVSYKSGKSLFIADAFSRTPGTETATVEEEYRVLTVHNLPITTQKLEQFKVEVNADTVLQKLSETVKQGWPERKLMVDPVIREYWSIKDEINVQDQLPLRRERLIVPATLRTEMLQKIHENHLGIEKCKRRARDILYWPGMNNKIAQMVARCEVCLTFRKSQ